MLTAYRIMQTWRHKQTWREEMTVFSLSGKQVRDSRPDAGSAGCRAHPGETRLAE